MTHFGRPPDLDLERFEQTKGRGQLQTPCTHPVYNWFGPRRPKNEVGRSRNGPGKAKVYVKCHFDPFWTSPRPHYSGVLNRSRGGGSSRRPVYRLCAPGLVLDGPAMSSTGGQDEAKWPFGARRIIIRDPLWGHFGAHPHQE